MPNKPGIMIYFDMLETVNRLSDQNAGRLFRAILQYGMTQQVPELPEKLFLIWPLVQMRLDNDDERYYRVARKRRYAIYVRWANEKGQTPLPYEEWLAQPGNTAILED